MIYLMCLINLTHVDNEHRSYSFPVDPDNSRNKSKSPVTLRSHKISRKEVTRDHVPTFRFPVFQKSKIIIPDILLFEFIQDKRFLLWSSQVLRVKTRGWFLSLRA